MRKKMKRLKEDGYFREMSDAYRLAIAISLSSGGAEKDAGEQKKTFLNIGSLDPDKRLYEAIRALKPNRTEPVYRIAERLAELGIDKIAEMAESGEISIRDILAEAGHDKI